MQMTGLNACFGFSLDISGVIGLARRRETSQYQDESRGLLPP
jgi:hypothetical protein